MKPNPNGPDDLLHSPAAQPGEGRLEQGVRDLPVVDAVEEVEVSPFRSVELVVGDILDGADGADRLVSPPRHEELRPSPLEEGMP